MENIIVLRLLKRFTIIDLIMTLLRFFFRRFFTFMAIRQNIIKKYAFKVKLERFF